MRYDRSSASFCHQIIFCPVQSSDLGDKIYKIPLNRFSKEKSLNFIVPNSFEDGIKIKEDPSGAITFVSKDGNINDWFSVTENISFIEYPSCSFVEMVYGNCMTACKQTPIEGILDHSIIFKHEEGIATASIFFDRPSVIAKTDQDIVGSKYQNELILSKFYNGTENVCGIQYLIRYDKFTTTKETKQALIKKMEDYFHKNTSIADLTETIHPKKNAKTVQTITKEMPQFYK